MPDTIYPETNRIDKNLLQSHSLLVEQVGRQLQLSISSVKIYKNKMRMRSHM